MKPLHRSFQYPGVGGWFINSFNKHLSRASPMLHAEKSACQESHGLSTCNFWHGGGTTAQCWSLFPPGLSSVLAEWGVMSHGLTGQALPWTIPCSSDPSCLPGTWALLMVGPDGERHSSWRWKNTTGSPVGSGLERPGDVSVPHSQGCLLGAVCCQEPRSLGKPAREGIQMEAAAPGNLVSFLEAGMAESSQGLHQT